MLIVEKDGTIILPQKLLKELGWSQYERLRVHLFSNGLLLEKTSVQRSGNLFICCFGRLSVEWKGMEIELKNQKMRELIALLVSENRHYLSKRYIASALWPDSSGEKGRDCLYKVIRHLKKYIDDVPYLPIEILHKKMRIWLKTEEVDFLLFEKICACGNLSEDQVQLLLKLYRNGFLEEECYDWSILLQSKYEILFSKIFKNTGQISD